jgi:hypothetical protein
VVVLNAPYRFFSSLVSGTVAIPLHTESLTAPPFTGGAQSRSSARRRPTSSRSSS